MGRPAVVGAALLSCLLIPRSLRNLPRPGSFRRKLGKGFVQKQQDTQLSVLGTGLASRTWGFRVRVATGSNNPSSAHCSACGFPS